MVDIYNLPPEKLVELLFIGVKGLNGDPKYTFLDMGQFSREITIACIKEMQRRVEETPALAASDCFAPIVQRLAAIQGNVYDPKKIASALGSLSRTGIAKNSPPEPQINPFRSFNP